MKHYLFLIYFVTTSTFAQTKKECGSIKVEDLFNYAKASRPERTIFKSKYTLFDLSKYSFPQEINDITIFNKPSVQENLFQSQIIERWACIDTIKTIERKKYYEIKNQYRSKDDEDFGFEDFFEDSRNFPINIDLKKYNISIRERINKTKKETIHIISPNTVVIGISDKDYISMLEKLKSMEYEYVETMSNDNSFAYKGNKYIIRLISSNGNNKRYSIAYTLL